MREAVGFALRAFQCPGVLAFFEEEDPVCGADVVADGLFGDGVRDGRVVHLFGCFLCFRGLPCAEVAYCVGVDAACADEDDAVDPAGGEGYGDHEGPGYGEGGVGVA